MKKDALPKPKGHPFHYLVKRRTPTPARSRFLLPSAAEQFPVLLVKFFKGQGHWLPFRGTGPRMDKLRDHVGIVVEPVPCI